MIIPEYFKDSELRCKCGCGMLPPARTMAKLYALRLIEGVPIVVISGARCKPYNKDRGYSMRHSLGAIDIQSSMEREYGLIRIAMLVGFTGIGIRDNRMLHLDDIPKYTPKIWTYK